ncbi:CPBP family intramembrane glutamic endopeptidase [Thalassotalea ganghwensis]
MLSTVSREIENAPLTKLTIYSSLKLISALIIIPSALSFIILNVTISVFSLNLSFSNIYVLIASNFISAPFTLFIFRHIMTFTPDILCKNAVTKKALCITLLAWLLIICVLHIIFSAVDLQTSNPLEGINDSFLTLLFGFIAICLLAPIIEELIFRGACFSLLQANNLSNITVVLISSILFTIVHVQYGITELSFVFILAIFFGAVRLKTQNIFLCIALHSLHNIYVFSGYIL